MLATNSSENATPAAYRAIKVLAIFATVGTQRVAFRLIASESVHATEFRRCAIVNSVSLATVPCPIRTPLFATLAAPNTAALTEGAVR